MKKKEILYLINRYKTIINNNGLLNPIKLTMHGRICNILKNEDEWFPNVSELKEQFEVLKQELLQAIDENEKLIRDTAIVKKCDHQVRIKYYNPFAAYYECVLCGKFSPNRFFESKYDNNYTVNFIGGNVEDDDYIENEKYREKILNIILKILKKFNDDDEVDLVAEFSKISKEYKKYISYIDTNPRREENYILIIGGTNKFYLNNEDKIFINEDYESNTFDFLDYFRKLLNTKVGIIENEKELSNRKYDDMKKDKQLEFIKYDTIESLNKYLNELKEIPFKIIINLSSLFDFSVEDDEIVKHPYNLNLQEMFPGSHIINISKLSSKSIEEIKSFLSKQKEISYVKPDDDENYYYVQHDEVLESNINSTCESIKELVRRH